MIVTFVIVIIGIYAFTALMQVRNRQLAAAEKVYVEFSTVVSKMVADENVPDDVARFLALMHADLHSASFVQYLLKGIIRGDLRNAEKKRKSAKFFLSLMDSMTDEQQNGFFKATTLFFIAETYNSFLLGTLMRRALSWLAKEANESRTKAVVSYELSRKNGFNGNNHAAA